MTFFKENPHAYQVMRINKETLTVKDVTYNGIDTIGIECTYQPMCIIGLVYKLPLSSTTVEIDKIANARVITFADGEVSIGDEIWVQYYY